MFQDTLIPLGGLPEYLGNPASSLSSWRLSKKPIRRLRTTISPIMKRDLFNFVESGIYKLKFDHGSLLLVISVKSL